MSSLLSKFVVAGVALGTVAGSVVVTSSAATAVTPTPRAVQEVSAGFSAHSAKLTGKDKKSLRAAVKEVNGSGAATSTQTLRVVGRAAKVCTRGDIHCTWRPLATARAKSVVKFVRSIGYQGSVTKAARAGSGATTAAFHYVPSTPTPTPPNPPAPPAPAVFSFQLINNSAMGGTDTAAPMSVDYECATGSCTGTAPAPAATAETTVADGSVLQSTHQIVITFNAVQLSGDYPAANVQATSATCVVQGNLTATITITCQVTADGATVQVRPAYG